MNLHSARALVGHASMAYSQSPLQSETSLELVLSKLLLCFELFQRYLNKFCKIFYIIAHTSLFTGFIEEGEQYFISRFF